MATFCMQTLGCEVSAIHTVNYSMSFFSTERRDDADGDVQATT